MKRVYHPQQVEDGRHRPASGAIVKSKSKRPAIRLGRFWILSAECQVL